MPDVEIDIDDLLDADSEEERALKLQVSSFQDVDLSSHRCLNPFGLQGFAGADSALWWHWYRAWVGAFCREGSTGVLGIHSHKLQL